MIAKKSEKIFVVVPPKLMRNFRIVLAMKGISMHDAIIKFVEHMVSVHLKEIDFNDVLGEKDE
jgi:hypothetical protein